MKKVLLVDDHSDIRRLLRIALGNGYQVFEAEDGLSALNIVYQTRPDLVVLDVMMPGEINGLNVLDKIKGDEKLRHVKVIMVTARGQANDYEEGIKRGADSYFIKPFSPRLVANQIKEFLDK